MDNESNTVKIKKFIELNNIVKIKKFIELDEKSYKLLIKKQDDDRKKHGYGYRLMSALFEKATTTFYDRHFGKKIEIPVDEIYRRQTIYLSEESNRKYNKLIVMDNYTSKALANTLVKTIYTL